MLRPLTSTMLNFLVAEDSLLLTFFGTSSDFPILMSAEGAENEGKGFAALDQRLKTDIRK